MYFRGFYTWLILNALLLTMPFQKNLLSYLLVRLKWESEEESLENVSAF